MLKRAIASLVGLVVLSPGALAERAGLQALCESLERRTIDCGCVATRIETFISAAPTPEDADVVREYYRSLVGADHDLFGALERRPSNPMHHIKLEEAFEPLGGPPGNDIEDYESGCVVPDTSPVVFSIPDEDPVAEYGVTAYRDRYARSTGMRAHATCIASRKGSRTSAQVFEAYFRSFSQYDEGSFDDDAARARSMGISVAEYEDLLDVADREIRAYDDADSAYCSAMLWANDEPGNSPAERARGGFDPEQLAPLASAAVDTRAERDTRPLTAESLIESGCAAQGNSESYCACYMRDYRQIAASQMPDEDTALAWALLNFGDSLPQSEYIRLMQELPQQAQQSAVMMTMSTAQVGETCTQGASGVEGKLSGSARSRMMKICMAENEDEALCNCMVDQMQEKLSASDFELVVDLREAEYRGIEDPLAHVAKERGLTRGQAEQGLGANQALTGGLMGMDVMSCLGGLPGGVAIPGLEQ